MRTALLLPGRKHIKNGGALLLPGVAVFCVLTIMGFDFRAKVEILHDMNSLTGISKPRTAVFVDGDNISPSRANEILEVAQAYGQLTLARVYCDGRRPSGWSQTPGYRMIHAGAGKNSADLLLAIDATEAALSHGFESVIIASSDGDFQHLAIRLRERGHFVLGLGEQKAPDRFRAACSAFTRLSDPTTPDCPTEVDQQIHAVIATHGVPGQGLPISALGPKMHAMHEVRISTLPEKSWREYLDKRPALYDLDPKGPEANVRCRPEGFAP